MQLFGGQVGLLSIDIESMQQESQSDMAAVAVLLVGTELRVVLACTVDSLQTDWPEAAALCRELNEAQLSSEQTSEQ